MDAKCSALVPLSDPSEPPSAVVRAPSRFARKQSAKEGLGASLADATPGGGSSHTHTARLEAFAADAWQARVLSRDTRSVRLHVPKRVPLSVLFRELESRKAELQLLEYSISETQLEQIFLQFAREAEGEGEAEAEGEGSSASSAGNSRSDTAAIASGPENDGGARAAVSAEGSGRDVGVGEWAALSESGAKLRLPLSLTPSGAADEKNGGTSRKISRKKLSTASCHPAEVELQEVITIANTPTPREDDPTTNLLTRDSKSMSVAPVHRPASTKTSAALVIPASAAQARRGGIKGQRTPQKSQ